MSSLVVNALSKAAFFSAVALGISLWMSSECWSMEESDQGVTLGTPKYRIKSYSDVLVGTFPYLETDVKEDRIDYNRKPYSRFLTVLERERQNLHSHVFVHSYGPKAGALYAVYSEIGNRLYDINWDHNWTSRILKPSCTITELSQLKNDAEPAFMRNAICASLSLYSNHRRASESSLQLWILGESVNEGTIRREAWGILENALQDLGVKDKTIATALDKIKQSYETIYPKTGELQQIFINDSYVDQCVYLSKDCGIPISFKKDGKVLAARKSLKLLRKGSIEKEEDLLYSTQARILVDPESFKNPDLVQVKTYHWDDETQEQISLFKREIASVIDLLCQDLKH